MSPSAGTPISDKVSADSALLKPKAFAVGDIAYAAYPIVPLGWLLQLGTLYAAVHYTLSARTRHAVRGNLAAIAGEGDGRRSTERRVWQTIRTHHVRNLQLLLAPRLVPRLRDILPIEGLEHLDTAAAAGRGVILMGAHINSVVELMGVMSLRERGYDVRTALPDESARLAPTKVRGVLNRLTDTPDFLELAGGMFTQFNVRPILKVLAARQIVCMMGDGWHSTSFVDVRFFGRTVPLTTGALSVARLSGAQVVPMFAVGTAPDQLRLVLEAPFTVSKAPDDDLAQKAQHFASRVEGHVRDNPTAWQHCFVDDAFAAMESWRRRSHRQRLAISP